MMSEFQPVDIKKYLRNPRKALDRIDRINSVNSVKPVSGESVEKKYQTSEPTLYDRLRERVEASAWAIPNVDRLREFFILAERGDEGARSAIEVYLEHPRVREELEASS